MTPTARWFDRWHPARGWWFCLFTMLLVRTGGLATVEPQLLPVGAPWRLYVIGADTPPPDSEWRGQDFDDAAWVEGRSGFSSLEDEATRIPGTMVTSVCFRAIFQVSDPNAVRWLVLRVDYVSGFVAYLNGTEILRRGVAGNPPPFDALASGHARWATEEVDVSLHRGLLVVGNNVLAIQLHGATLPASDLVLVLELCANFSRGPYIQNVSTQGCQILWRTPVAASTVVEHGPTPDLGQTYTEATFSTNHVASLTGLPPDTEWFYRVRSATEGDEAVSPLARFRTLRTAGEVSFAVLGDSGSGWLAQLQVASCLATAQVDLVLHAGDITYPMLTPALVDTRNLSIYAPQMRCTPFYFTVGNHELYAANGQATYLETFRLPTNTVTGSPHFYSFDHGNAHFVSLFVPTLNNFAGTSLYALHPGSLQLQWLTNDLASTTRPWRILLLHSPLFSSAGHRTDDFNYNGIPDRLELQAWLLPVAAQFGVQVIFSGHDHCFERFAPTNGVQCLVSGGGGYVLYGMIERDALSQRFEARHHYLRAATTGDSLHVQAVDRWGVVFDSVTIPRVSPPRLRAQLSSPHTLRLEWNSAPGVQYQIEAANAPSGPFTPVEHPALPITATAYQTDLDLAWSPPPNSPAAQFYRISLLPASPGQ